MRQSPLIVLILLAASPVLAQEYAEQAYTPPQTAPQAQQLSGNFYAEPVFVPQQPANSAQSPQPYHPTTHAATPNDYGQTGMTDIRQMNF
ncbi:MAG: hypothetical protein ACOYNL_02720 [Rickettsiales bacterium]